MNDEQEQQNQKKRKITLEAMATKIVMLFIQEEYTMEEGMAVLAMLLAETAYDNDITDIQVIDGFVKTVSHIWDHKAKFPGSNNVTAH
jgi:hypothetical protein